MKQSVNLYRDALRPRRVILPTRWLAAVVALALAVVGVTYGLLAWQLDQRRAALADLQAERERLSARLEQLSTRLAERQVDPALERRAGALSEELRTKRRLLGVIEGQTGEQTARFSELVAALGRQHQQGLWLEEIAIARGGAELALRGRVTEATLVPSYLQALSNEPAYQGRAFTTFRLGPQDDGEAQSGPLSFVIATQCPGVDKGPIKEAVRCLEGGGDDG